MSLLLSLFLLVFIPLSGLCGEFEHPLELFDEGNYRQAIKRCKTIIRENPDGKDLGLMWQLVGRSFEKLGKPAGAVEPYIEALKNSVDEAGLAFAWRRLRAIADYHYSRAGSRRFGRGDYVYASEVLTKMVETCPYHNEAGHLRLKIGLCAMECGDFDKAITELKEVVDNCKGKSVIEKAVFHLGASYFKKSLPWPYDQSATEAGVSYFSLLEERFPESPLLPEAGDMKTILVERKAEKLYHTAEFYRKSEKENASSIYLRQLLNKYPATSWGRLAKNPNG